jgi:energy-converting hydrogenase Eha subunit F
MCIRGIDFVFVSTIILFNFVPQSVVFFASALH